MYAKNIDKVDLNLLEYKRQYKYRDEKRRIQSRKTNKNR